MNTYECFKCGFAFSPGADGGSWEEGPDCLVPDPIKIEGLEAWGVAMEWRDKIMAGKDSTVFANNLLDVFGGGTEGDIDECFAFAQPKHYLIAAALAEGAKE